MALKKVLVIDDSIMIRKMVKNILADQFEVIEASDGKSGIETARSVQPDIILLDFVMPKYNGYQTLQAMRRIDSLKDTPVIMISGLREQVAEHVPEPFEGFEFLEKPFEAEVLIDRIKKLLHVSSTSAAAAPAPAPETTLQTSQALMDKLAATEHLLIQGIESLIQREVAARLAAITNKMQKQEASLANLEKKIEAILQQVDNQNKGLMVILREVKAIRGN
ncbi:MAG: response regulator [Pseudanabaenaceae cyanobacterium SKYGB_i_bin29]|nr:response regulator [Pseudanabaenaceae cyanobacterium SKYG29]MDW8421983.1 response regulator [Pseudanabaenaceae cyanobacterium SKYGB_i_bin29]